MIRRLILILPFLLYSSGVAASDEGGTQSVFTFGVGARDLALGGAGLALGDYTTAPLWNASRLARAERFAASLSHSQLYESDVTYQYIGLVVPTMDFGTLGVGISRLGIGGIEKRDRNNLLLGGISDDYLSLYFAYGRVVSGYDLGMAVSIEHHSLDTYTTTSSPGLNLSLSREAETRFGWLSRVRLAVTGTNVVRPQMELADQSTQYPRRVDGGISFVLGEPTNGSHAAIASMSLGKVDRGDFALAVGAEYGWQGLIHLRGGYRAGDLSAGAGFIYGNMSIDYAWVDRDLGAIHYFTVSMTFGISNSEKRLRRTQKREAEFSSLFQAQLHARNSEMVNTLGAQTDSLLSSGDLTEASQRCDRALFLARNSGLDTTQLVALSEQVRVRLRERERSERFSRYLDSANVRLQMNDCLAARYFAGLALEERSDSPEALQLQERASKAIQDLASRDEILQQQLLAVDSLLSYGQVAEANVAVNALYEWAPDKEGVTFAHRRVRFELWRQRASTAYANRDYAAAGRALDSALALFPQHQWCADLQTRLKTEAERSSAETAQRRATPRQKVPPEALKQADESYGRGQGAFKEGRLAEAILRWEQVEQLVPAHKSVREYLVSAYRLVGIELYGQNRLDEAVATWKKAQNLQSDNREIRAYIDRTEAELLRLKELSYEQH